MLIYLIVSIFWFKIKFIVDSIKDARIFMQCKIAAYLTIIRVMSVKISENIVYDLVKSDQSTRTNFHSFFFLLRRYKFPRENPLL